MHNFTRNRFPIKNLLIDSLLTPIVESTYHHHLRNLEPLSGKFRYGNQTNILSWSNFLQK